MTTSEETRPRLWQRRWFQWAAGSVLAAVVIFFAVAEYLVSHASPILRKRIIATLSERFDAPVELDTFDISLIRGIEVSGGGLRVPYKSDVSTGTMDPHKVLISVDHFSFRASWHELMEPKTHIAVVDVDGVMVDLPPKNKKEAFGPNENAEPADPENQKTKPKIAFVVDELRGSNVRLVIENKDPNKESKVWEIRDLTVHDLGATHPAKYVATVINPIPKGEIKVTGHVGPWNAADPRQTFVDGDYTFNNADMNTIKGLGGTLNAKGRFTGVLEKLTTDGVTDTPDFSLDISDHPIPLHTEYHAYVDATTGDTVLDPVHAMLGETPILCSGAIINIKGKGHDISLDAEIHGGRMTDVLALGMKSKKPIMQGVLTMKSHIHIPPGKERVSQKIELAGDIDIASMTLTNPMLQDKMDGLSMRAQGKPNQMPVAATDKKTGVLAHVKTKFTLEHSRMLFPNIEYEMPGAHVRMQGAYDMDGSVFEFKGLVRTDATASQMVTGWKSWLLKPVDPLLKKDGAGVQLPIQITGVKDDVHFGLAFKHGEDSAKDIQQDLSAKRAAGAINMHPKKKLLLKKKRTARRVKRTTRS